MLFAGDIALTYTEVHVELANGLSTTANNLLLRSVCEKQRFSAKISALPAFCISINDYVLDVVKDFTFFGLNTSSRESESL
ncbi:hypothetical protein RRG08_049668 [Elysia crispata]|uniref:Uncharacterized protein n=1 Tax=Elysia crispata TaxID=231223 RepID=A0AAE0Y7P9_9GAST|nr:hypothetical protein RRG08_049668 [Elysia crispata]